MKNLRKILVTVFVITLAFVIYSCSSEDGYLKFTEGGEISYTGKIDSLKVFSGHNRAAIEGLIFSDPKVSELKIYWNNRVNSITIPIERTAGVDMVSAIIPDLPENIYNFEVRTFDADGNGSISQFVTVEVFGNRYLNSLTNRPVVSNVLLGNMLTINYADMDLSTGVQGTEVKYSSVTDEIKTVFVPISDVSVVINDFKSGSTYQYRTVFKPTETAIDDFYTAYVNVKPIVAPVLLNAKQPFTASATDGGRWGNLADWTSNAAIKNHNGYGGWDGGCCGKANASTWNTESGWGAPGITNGKIYQTVTAEAATFRFKVVVFESNYDVNDPGGSYFVVAKGNGIPDVENLATAPEVLKYKRVLGHGIGATEYILEFTVDQAGPITVGFVTSQPDWGRFCTIKSLEIVVAN